MVKKKADEKQIQLKKEDDNPPTLINDTVTIEALSYFLHTQQMAFGALQQLNKLDRVWVDEQFGAEYTKNMSMLVTSVETEVKRMRTSIPKLFTEEWTAVIGHIVDFMYSTDILIEDLKDYLEVAKTNTSFKQIMEKRLVSLKHGGRYWLYPQDIIPPCITKFDLSGIVELSTGLKTLMFIVDKKIKLPKLKTLTINFDKGVKIPESKDLLFRMVVNCGLIPHRLAFNVKYGDKPSNMNHSWLIDILRWIGAVVLIDDPITLTPNDTFKINSTGVDNFLKPKKKRKIQEKGPFTKKKK